MYPEIEPYSHGMLDVGDGNRTYWEACGRPDGKPAVVLHGGPGTGCNKGMRRLFDPNAYRIVLFDQRGSGRSTPCASVYETDLSVNTTEHLLADMEQLRAHLGIDRWLIWGGSWGVTLGLAYAERHPERVTEMVLTGVTTTRRSEIDWLYRGVSPLFPEQWARFRAGVPEADRDSDLVEVYARLLESSDAEVREQAALNWCEWEWSLVSTQPDYKPGPRWLDPVFRMTFARLVTHYFRHNGWLEEGILIRNAHRLRGIPGILVHGRLDLDAPLTTAWELAQAWPDSELVIVSGAGHSGSDPGMTEAVLAATDRFARME
jgi:proline iminopeptidase